MDEEQHDVYFIEGSFLKIPKSFTITDVNGNEIAQITKKILTILPKFEIDIVGESPVEIKKEFSFLKSRYTVYGQSIEVRGNLWDMDFEIFKDGQLIGAVSKQYFTWADTYHISIHDELFEKLIVTITVAIDCVKEDQNGASDASLFL